MGYAASVARLDFYRQKARLCSILLLSSPVHNKTEAFVPAINVVEPNLGKPHQLVGQQSVLVLTHSLAGLLQRWL